MCEYISVNALDLFHIALRRNIPVVSLACDHLLVLITLNGTMAPRLYTKFFVDSL